MEERKEWHRKRRERDRAGEFLEDVYKSKEWKHLIEINDFVEAQKAIRKFLRERQNPEWKKLHLELIEISEQTPNIPYESDDYGDLIKYELLWLNVRLLKYGKRRLADYPEEMLTNIDKIRLNRWNDRNVEKFREIITYERYTVEWALLVSYGMAEGGGMDDEVD